MSDARSQPMRAALSPGTRLNGVYEIDQQVASGGMGEIYRAHAIQTKDTVAIKMMLPELAANPAVLALFRKEASALHNLHHDAIVRYFVFSVEPTLKRPYLAMEFVEGQTLSDLIKRGPLVFEAVHTLMRRLAAGLQAAHERGIVHRDVSPDNVIIPRGADVARAKIIDFGIARSLQTGAQTVIGGGFAGKYNYVSPEQLGLFGGDVTAKSDIYSLGLLLVEALTGKPLDMGGSQVAVLEKRRRVPDLGGIDLRIRPLIDRMLQPNPADRPDSMADVANWSVGGAQGLLRRRDADAPSGRYAKAEPESEPEPREGMSRRAIALAAGAAALVVIGIGTAVYYILQPPTVLLAPPAPSQQTSRLEVGSPRPTPQPSAPPTPSLLAPQPPPPPVLGAGTPTVQPPPAATPPPLIGTPPPGSTPPPLATAPPAARPTSPPTAAQPAAPLGNQAALAPPAGPTLTPSGPSPAAPAGPALTPTPPPLLTAPPPAASLPAAPTVPTYSPPPLAAAPPGGGLMPNTGGDRALQVEAFILQYEGGDCFFIAPVAVSATAAQIEGFGAVLGAFQTLDTAFKQTYGFEADIGVRQVTIAQCPAVTFLARIRREALRAPRLTLNEALVRSGEILHGSVSADPSLRVALLLVTDEGMAYNVSLLLKPAADGQTFNMGLQRAGGEGARPQLVMALTSAQPLKTVEGARGVPANDLFPRIAAEIAAGSQPVGVAARYFKLD